MSGLPTATHADRTEPMQLIIEAASHVVRPAGCALPLPQDDGVIVPLHAPPGRDTRDYLRHGGWRAISDHLVRDGFGFALVLPDRVGLFSDWTNRRRLYYEASSGRITISDHLSSFPGRPTDIANLRLLLSFKFVPPPLTPLESVYKLPAGHEVWLSRATGETLSRERYLRRELYLSGAEPGSRLRPLLEEYLREYQGRRTTVFLSGGFDSTLLATLAREAGMIDTAYTVTYDSHNGRLTHSQAEQAANHLGLRLRTLAMDRDAFQQSLMETVGTVDEPFADIASVAECALARRAEEEGWELVLEGEGADSCFGGSYKFLMERYAAWIHPIARFEWLLRRLPQNRRGRVAGLVMKAHTVAQSLATEGGFERTFDFLQSAAPITGPQPERWREVEQEYQSLYELGSDPLNSMAAATFWGVIPYLENRKLEAVERFSSVRLLVPFLDPRLVRQAFRTPGNRKVKWGYGKYPLRKEFGSVLPRHVRSRKKLSFVPPVGDWIVALQADTLLAGRIVPRKIVSSLVAEQRSGWRDHTPLLWAIFCAENWIDRFQTAEPLPEPDGR